MFKKELAGGRVEKIIQKIDDSLEAKQKDGKKHIETGEIVHDIMKIWTDEITDMVKSRKEAK